MTTVQALIDGYGPKFPGLETLLGVEASEAAVLKMSQPIPGLDRYLSDVRFLQEVTSGRALGLSRFNVIIEYFLQLSDMLADYNGTHAGKKVVDRISDADKERIRQMGREPADILRAEFLERFTEHDTAAATDWLKIRIGRELPHLEGVIEGVHFANTSEDVMGNVFGQMFNTLIYGYALPAILNFCDSAIAYVQMHETADRPLLAPGLTHRQAAEPQTLGKKFMTIVNAILTTVDNQFIERTVVVDGESPRVVERFRPASGKFGGALGNYTTHFAAYPDIDWEAMGKRYVESFGLQYQPLVHQSSPFTVEAMQFMVLDTILGQVMKFAQDFLDLTACPGQFFVKKKAEGVKGSSIMPQKSNPWEMEGAQRMLGEAREKLRFYARELPNFPHEGDIGRSYLCRNLGDVFMPMFIGLSRVAKGLSKYVPNHTKIDAFYAEYPGMAGSSIQMVLKRENIAGDAYREIQKISTNPDGTYADAAQFRAGLERVMDEQGLGPEVRAELRGLLDPYQAVAPVHRIVQREMEAAATRIAGYRKQLAEQRLLPRAA